jgi:suppressor of ftsI
LLLLLAAVTTPAKGQHEGHNMSMTEGNKASWRMPPMDAVMPMLPGLADAMPPVKPFLAGEGMDPAMVPESRPREIYDLEDGDEINLEAGLVRRTIRGKNFIAYGYNGQFPGPLIRARQGSTIRVHFTNKIEMPTTVRWHGMRVDYQFDGTPVISQAPVPRGESFTYEVRFTDSGIFWYHAQVRVDIQMDLGLYGSVLVAPLEDDYYGDANREEVLVLDDFLMDEMGPLPWGADAPTHALMGRYGNVMLINGSTDYTLSVRRGEVVRFFLTNAANSRIFNVAFGGLPIKIVAGDLGKYERESWTESVVIAPAERYVIEVQFDDPGEIRIENAIQAINHFRGEFYPRVDRLGTVRVSDEPVTTDLSAGFTHLRENEDVVLEMDRFRPYFDSPPDRRIELSLKVKDLPIPIMLSMALDTLYVPPIEWNDAMPMMNWLSTGTQVFWVLRDLDTGLENMEIFWDFDKGDVAKIRFFNNPKTIHPMNHPIHIHGQRFLVLEMDGVRNPNLVWKDTAIIPVASTVDILVDMSNPGDWVLHCHIAEHLHSGMMLSFGVWEEEE